MPATVRMTMVFLLAFLPLTLLQGCGGGDSGGGSGTSSPGASMNLTLGSTSGANTLTADGVSSLDLEMTATNQEDGRPIVGLEVTFTATAGILSPSGTANTNSRTVNADTRQTAGGNSVTVLTDANGVARVTLTATNAVGAATVTAETPGGFRQSFAISFISGVPANISLSVVPTAVGVGDTATATATVTDNENRPVAGTAVVFSITANSSSATLSQTSITTDGNGIASVTYTGGATQGTDTIQASVGELSTTAAIVVQGQTSSADNIDLLVSNAQIDSDGVNPITLTALVRDANNNFVSGQEVTFAASSGGIQVTSNITDASGAATAQLTTAGDPANRTINVTATSGTLTATNSIEVSGTTITISGSDALVLGDSATLSVLLQDSGGNGIAQEEVNIASALGNTLSSTTVITDFNGQATLQVTASVGGQDTITAAAMVRDGAPTVSGTAALSVSAADFTFIEPVEGDREVALNELKTVTIRWLDGGDPQAGRNVSFFVTRGQLQNLDGSQFANPIMTDANGEASAQVSATTAGPAIITAEVDEPNGPSAQIAIEYVANDPTSLILQASPAQLGVNLPGNTDQQSIITAVLRDDEDNLVKNQQVVFTLTDNTGGSIFPSSAITDSFGRASTVYTAGSSVSAQDGVFIDAEVIGTPDSCIPTDTVPTGPCDRVTLTVAQQSLFVTLGTSQLINALDETRYAKPYSVLVSDVNGNPVQGADVELNIFPVRYEKGFYYPFTSAQGNCAWNKVRSVSHVNRFNFADDEDRACDSEDLNRNGILETSEDINNNEELDPENPVAVPVQVTTDESGFGIFNLTYAREFTWVTVELEARTVVAGSEAFSKSTFVLPGLASDFNNCEVEPPGRLSPYGRARSCICDEFAPVYQVTDYSLTLLDQALRDLAQSRIEADLETEAIDQIIAGLNTLIGEPPHNRRNFLERVAVAVTVELNTELDGIVEELILEHSNLPETFVITGQALANMQQPLTELAQSRSDLSVADVNQIIADLTNLLDPNLVPPPRNKNDFLVLVLDTISITFTDEAKPLVLEIILEYTIQIGQCPILTSIPLDRGVELTPSESKLPPGGTPLLPSIGRPPYVEFLVRGGTEFKYTISTTHGRIINDPVLNQDITEIEFGQRFYLVTTSQQNGEFITVVVTDQDTGFNAVIGMQQEGN